MKIDNRDLEQNILVVAEIGQNHNGDMTMARKLITAAKEAGADIAKFQLFDVEAIFPADDQRNKMRKKAQLSREQVEEVADYCQKTGIEFMASVFDRERVKWCQDIGMKRYKIASRSIYDSQLIEAITDTGKDIIASLGMYREKGFPRIKTSGRVDFLYCVAKYPTLPEDLDFLTVDFNQFSGFSDHTIGIEASLIAMARGARIIEKHFTLDKKLPGPDHIHSVEPDELKQMVEFARKCAKILYHAKEQ
ncbi:MAG: N-acetylneuraminate synthase family protein [Chloroflexi bacterium]|nr:N-acetylneuraminate synthase family protein [Chloroflexota bacterium]MBI3931000.1 N-acetylneuraminate synthase family protein [Chloroflexota bacterium]